MTNKEAKIIIGNIPIKPEVLDDCYDITEYQEAKTMAIKALEDIEKIKAIIRTPKNFLEQDVYRYKMICEVIANECKTESKEAEERA